MKTKTNPSTWLVISALASDGPYVKEEWQSYLRERPPVSRVELMCSFFEHSHLMRHTLAPNEIAFVLHAIVDDGVVYVPDDLLDTSVPIETRLNAIRSIRNVFTELFVPFIESIALHDQRIKNLAAECELWWERFPQTWHDDDSKAILDSVVWEIEVTLQTGARCAFESAICGARHIGESRYENGLRLLETIDGLNTDEQVASGVSKARDYLSRLHGA